MVHVQADLTKPFSCLKATYGHTASCRASTIGRDSTGDRNTFMKSLCDLGWRIHEGVIRSLRAHDQMCGMTLALTLPACLAGRCRAYGPKPDERDKLGFKHHLIGLMNGSAKRRTPQVLRAAVPDRERLTTAPAASPLARSAALVLRSVERLDRQNNDGAQLAFKHHGVLSLKCWVHN